MTDSRNRATPGTKLIGGLLVITGLGFLAIAGLTLMHPAYIGAYTGASGILTIGLPVGLGFLAGLTFLAAYDLIRMRRRGWLIAIYTYGIAMALDITLGLATPQPFPAGRIILTLLIIGYLFHVRDRFRGTDDNGSTQRQGRQQQPRQQRPPDRRHDDRETRT